jgi:hypothetical protein
VKSHDTSADMGVPEIFLTPLLPPVITALYVIVGSSGELGVKVAVAEPAL